MKVVKKFTLTNNQSKRCIMNRKIFYLILVVLVISLSNNSQSQDIPTRNLTKYVDPFIGTEGGGHVFPGASLPFGMVKLGPDCGDLTSNSGYKSTGNIKGFSHVHVSGTGGGPKYGNVLVMPVTGDIDLANFSSPRAQEKASLGYYETDLTRYNVNARLSVTHKTGFHQYTFPATDQAHILIDAGSFLKRDHPESQQLVGSEIHIISKTEIGGYTRVRGGWNMGEAYTVYFYAKFDTEAESWGTWKGDSLNERSRTEIDTGEKTGAYLTFKTRDQQEINLKVGISFISEGKARKNLYTDIADWNFSKVKLSASYAWNHELNKVHVDFGSEEDKKIFYTALYHSMLMPVDRTGENPKWLSDTPYYDDYYAIWDTFRATHPLLSILNPDKQVEMLQSLLAIYEMEGYMPDARSGNENGRTQGGSNCDILIADAYVKGLKGLDYEKALQAMLKNAEIPPGDDARQEGRGGILAYNELGYVPTNLTENGKHLSIPQGYERAGTRTVEYANCDWAIAQVAKGLGKNDIYKKYKKRASNWENLWRSSAKHDGESGFIWPKTRDGKWIKNFDALKAGSWNDFFYESHSWEYSLYVPQDVKGLIEKCGGKEAFISRLNHFFENNYFNISNEPGFFTPCLYTYAGRPDKTAEVVKNTLRNHYSTKRSGLPGNDDAGSMSAWYAFHAIGLYPNAGQNVYIITSPVFGQSKIHLNNGKTFTINAENLSNENIYIIYAELNGQPLDKAWITHEDIVNGGELFLEMGDMPTEWGTKNPPPSISD